MNTAEHSKTVMRTDTAAELKQQSRQSLNLSIILCDRDQLLDVTCCYTNRHSPVDNT